MRAEAFLNKQPDIVALYITSPENIRYFSGYTGEGALLVAPDTRVIITDSRYTTQAAQQAPAWLCIMADAEITQSAILAGLCEERAIDALGFEAEVCSVTDYETLVDAMPGVRFVAIDGAVLDMRSVKDAQEIDCLSRAGAIADDAFTYILGQIRPGITENEIALLLEMYMRMAGADGIAFPTIVASGENGALPHATPSGRKLQNGDLVTMDYGCVVGGYHSDMTRTVALGQACQELIDIYEIVKAAQQAALEALSPGMTGQEADAVARTMINEAGYGAYFGHGLGHGVGLAIHESPRLTRGRAGEKKLLCGQAVTVEPGIYLPGQGGVRIEDFCIIEAGGARRLSHSTKEFIRL